MKQNILLSALLAAMLVIAGCGGGNSSTPATAAVVEGSGTSNGNGNGNMNGVNCQEGQTVMGGACVDPTPKPTPDPKFPAGVTAKTLVGTDGEIRSPAAVGAGNQIQTGATRITAGSRNLAIENGAYSNSNSGGLWHDVLTVVNKDISGNGQKQRVVSASGYKVPGTDDDNPFPANNGAIGNAAGTAALANYNGIPGIFYCADGETCAENGRTLGTGWYFVPGTNVANHLWKLGDDGEYERTDNTGVWVEWGYWVTHASSNSESTINREISIILNGATAIDAASLAAPTELVSENNKATYTGKAHGVSVMGDSAGTFTADASLTATFAATPTLEGMISGFTGQAVGSGWELKAGVAVADIRAPVRGTGADRR
ncbi:MAG: hypothetical protein OXD01_01650 [Gammaproteobacteria bacterium]|nr:hypothetical protein [Gammaproteobacteria bacterium]